jgi:hypothetical protein
MSNLRGETKESGIRNSGPVNQSQKRSALAGMLREQSIEERVGHAVFSV